MRWLDGIIYSGEVSLSKLQEIVEEGKAWHTVHEVSKNRTLLNSNKPFTGKGATQEQPDGRGA